jgi:hypothetical protein
MKLSTFANLTTGLYKSGVSIYLRGGVGQGKTTSIEASVPRIAQDLGKTIGFNTISGPNLTPGDTIGFGIPKHYDDISEMIFTQPFFTRTPEGKRLEQYDGGILFIDEADKMDIDVKKVVGEMALSGRCGPHKLPPGWVVWMAGNRQGDRSGSTKELDHLINRRVEIDITPDAKGWEKWALRNGVHPTIVAFAVQNPQIVFTDEVPKDQGPWCTPRSLVNTGKLLATFASNDDLPTDDDMIELAAGGIGKAAAAQLFATIRLASELPDFGTVVKNPDTAKVPSAPDAQMLACYQLASKADTNTLGPVVQYVERMPADFAATFAKAACTRVRMFAAHPAMMDWTKRNNTLMTTLNMFK